MLDRLKELEYRTVGFNGGASPSDGGRYLNARAEAYWRLREKLEAGELALPPDEKLMDEISRSPDRADAVCMAVAGEVARKRQPTGGIATA